MTENIEDDAELEKSITPRWLWLVGLILLYVMSWFAAFGYKLYENGEKMGQWGDFFGGILNPILSFFAFAGLLYTILLQRRELEYSRKELRRSSLALEAQNSSMKQQRFESTLFGMIGVLNQIIDAMDVEKVISWREGTKREYKGRDCFILFFEKLDSIYDARPWNKEPIYEDRNDSKRIDYPHDEKRIKDTYSHFYDEYASDLGHYFRVLYNIFSYIKNSDFADEIYYKILRAQLSNQELIILYYNCHSDMGRNFRELAVQFEIFDNMDHGKLIRPEHVKLLPPEVFGENKPE